MSMIRALKVYTGEVTQDQASGEWVLQFFADGVKLGNAQFFACDDKEAADATLVQVLAKRNS